MSQLDRLKELLATDISLIGWLISSFETAGRLTVLLAAVGAVLRSCGIAVLHRDVEARIEQIGAL